MTIVFSPKHVNKSRSSHKLVGLDEEFQKIKAFCEVVWSKDWDDISHNLQMLPTILLHGSPGTGKTSLLSKIAESFMGSGNNKVKYYRESLDLFAAKDLGETSKNIKELFSTILEEAKSGNKVFLQLDDIDSLLSSRYISNESSGVRRAVNTFITQIDELSCNSKELSPIISSTTNMTSYIDTAIKRRFSLTMETRPILEGDNLKEFLTPKMELLKIDLSSIIAEVEGAVKEKELTPYDLLLVIQHFYLNMKIGKSSSGNNFIEKIKKTESSLKLFDKQEHKFSKV